MITDYQKFIHASRYARWDYDLERRETIEESFNRYLDFFEQTLLRNNNFSMNSSLRDSLFTAMTTFEVMPSMRALMTAGPALERDNVAGYNCSALPIDNMRAFDETMYILMCGTGVGYSVERQHIQKLPVISDHFTDTNTIIRVHDSKTGWAVSFRELLSLLISGRVPKFDLSDLRPAGAPLKTFGGRSSGPGPLEELFYFAIDMFVNAAGRKLTSLEAHDLLCKIGEIVIVGGVRRSALISLSNLSDHRMRDAKSGNWWEHNPQRSLANNSAVYTEKPDSLTFMEEWISLVKSQSGERGIFNRQALTRKAASLGRDPDVEYLTNPCGEIILPPNSFCNLSEVVLKPEDTFDTIADKVRLATIIGTFQSSLTDFRYLRPIWKETVDAERLLGVSFTGIMDREKLEPEDLVELRLIAEETNLEFSKKLEIEKSMSITCVKPSGTCSQLTDSSSGIHFRYAPYYIRRVRGSLMDPITKFMIDKGIPNEPCVNSPDTTVVFSFPQKAPEYADTEYDEFKLYDTWHMYAKYWCDHNPSCTIEVSDKNWMQMGAKVYDDFDDIGGLTFLPRSGHTYRQAPYEEIAEEEYNALVNKMPSSIDWTELSQYEIEDRTTASQELACSGNSCEIVDIV